MKNPFSKSVFFQKNISCGIITALLLFSVSCSTKINLTKTETAQYRMNSDYGTGDSLTAAEIAPYKKTIDGELNTVIAVSEQALEKNTPEGLLGDLVADACLKKANENPDYVKIDFCFLNNGGLRNSLPKGEITKKKIFELMPFENELVYFTLRGDLTKKLLDFMANKGGMPVSGVRFKIIDNKAQNIFISTAAFDINKSYVISTSDYLANGGDDLTFLSEATDKKYLNLKVRDAIIQYLVDETRRGNSIKVSLDGRISK